MPSFFLLMALAREHIIFAFSSYGQAVLAPAILAPRFLPSLPPFPFFLSFFVDASKSTVLFYKLISRPATAGVPAQPSTAKTRVDSTAQLPPSLPRSSITTDIGDR